MVIRSQCRTKIVCNPTRIVASEGVMGGIFISMDNEVVGHYEDVKQVIDVLDSIESAILTETKYYEMPKAKN